MRTIEGGPMRSEYKRSTDSLLGSVAQGDRAAFADLYDELSEPVLAIVSRVVGDVETACEVVQDIFLEVWRKAPTYDPAKASARAWVLTMAHRRAVDRRRVDLALRSWEAAAGIRDFPWPHDPVSEAGETAIDRRRIREAFDSLSVLQQQAVALRYYEGLSNSEISAGLDVPVDTVKTRLRDGLQRLRAVMARPV